MDRKLQLDTVCLGKKRCKRREEGKSGRWATRSEDVYARYCGYTEDGQNLAAFGGRFARSFCLSGAIAAFNK